MTGKALKGHFSLKSHFITLDVDHRWVRKVTGTRRTCPDQGRPDLGSFSVLL